MPGRRPAMKKYLVTLTPDEGDGLERMVSSGRRAAKALTRARILLEGAQADGGRNGPAGDEKNEVKPWVKEQWVNPAEERREFVGRMEDVLDLYQRRFDERRPLVAIDEVPKQLVGEVRAPVPARPGCPARCD